MSATDLIRYDVWTRHMLSGGRSMEFRISEQATIASATNFVAEFRSHQLANVEYWIAPAVNNPALDLHRMICAILRAEDSCRACNSHWQPDWLSDACDDARALLARLGGQEQPA